MRKLSKKLKVFETVRAASRLIPKNLWGANQMTGIEPGEAPGIAHRKDIHTKPEPGTVAIELIDYDTNSFEQTQFDDINDALAAPLKEGRWRWININGLHPYVVRKIQEHYQLHSLVAEDILNNSIRPKTEQFDENLFTVVRMFQLAEDTLKNEQISFYLGANVLLTFQETTGDVWGLVRERMKPHDSRFRKNGLPYLKYALLDAIVDHCFPILEAYLRRLDDIEERLMFEQERHIQWLIHDIKREVIGLGRVLFPMREVIDRLCRGEEGKVIPKTVRTYLRDVHDHAVQVMDIVENCRETAASLNELYLANVSHRMNEVMKVLTIMASLFIPITFFAGVYGMNFEHIPELGWQYSYPAFWLVCITMVGSLLFYFKKKGWF